MIKIQAEDKTKVSDFAKTINCLSDLLNIKTSHLFPDKLDFTLNKNIHCDIHKHLFIIEGLYFLDNKFYIYALDISSTLEDEEIEKDFKNIEFGTELVYTADATLNGKEEDGKKYIYRKPESFTATLKPLEVREAKTGNQKHIHIEHIFEFIFRYNADLLSEEQHETLYNYFREYVPQVIEANDTSTAMTEISIKTTLPANYVGSTDKVSNSVYGLNVNKPQLYFNESADINVAGKGIGGNSEVIVRATLELSKDSNIKGIERLSLFDHRVHGAIGSWYYAGNTYITHQMIHHVITGDGNSRITDTQYKNIVDSVNLMREVRVTIDATEENEKYYSDSDKQSRFNGNIIDAIEFENIPLNGQLSSGFIIRGEPLLFIYARQKKQLYGVPLNYLKSPVDKTKETIILHDYILHRIEVMKNPNNNMTNVIAYNSIYHIVGEQNGIPFTKQKKERIRKNTQKILDDLISKGAIKNYRKIKKGKEIYSVEITY